MDYSAVFSIMLSRITATSKILSYRTGRSITSNSLKHRAGVFSISPEQAGYFTGQFDEMLKRSKLLLGNDLEANIKRLGLVTFRMAMILSALRMLDDGDLSASLVCSDTDFTTALSIATTLEKHAVAVYKSLRPDRFSKPVGSVYTKYF